jgi:hypothetical protein
MSDAACAVYAFEFVAEVGMIDIWCGIEYDIIEMFCKKNLPESANGLEIIERSRVGEEMDRRGMNHEVLVLIVSFSCWCGIRSMRRRWRLALSTCSTIQKINLLVGSVSLYKAIGSSVKMWLFSNQDDGGAGVW